MNISVTVHALRDVLRPTLGACVNDASEWPKARCVEAVRAHGLPMPEGAEKPPTANELKETLRPAVQPGACTPTLVLPTGHAAPIGRTLRSLESTRDCTV